MVALVTTKDTDANIRRNCLESLSDFLQDSRYCACLLGMQARRADSPLQTRPHSSMRSFAPWRTRVMCGQLQRHQRQFPQSLGPRLQNTYLTPRTLSTPPLLTPRKAQLRVDPASTACPIAQPRAHSKSGHRGSASRMTGTQAARRSRAMTDLSSRRRAGERRTGVEG